MKSKTLLTITLASITFLIITLIPLISSDTISVNPSGSDSISISPTPQVDAFFSVTGEIVATPAEEEEEEETPAAAGGGGGGSATIPQNLELSHLELNLNLKTSTNKEQIITITNTGLSTATLTPSQTNLDNMVIFNQKTITLLTGESKDLKIIFVASETPGIYTGKIQIGNQQILVSLNIKTKLLLFDSSIVVLNKNYLVKKAGQLETEVTLIPMGDKERLDVTLDYVIKDYDGKIYLTKQETLLVTEQTELKRNFDIGGLALGEYIIGLELTYPNGVAPSSAHFTVVEQIPGINYKKIAIYLGIGIGILLILILIVIIIRILWKKMPRIEIKTRKIRPSKSKPAPPKPQKRVARPEPTPKPAPPKPLPKPSKETIETKKKLASLRRKGFIYTGDYKAK